MRGLTTLGLLLGLWLLALPAAANPRVLIETAELAQQLDDPNLRIIEVSVNTGQFERGHIPNAVNAIWQTEFSDPIQRDIVSQANLESLLRRFGVNHDTRIVLYGDNYNWFAAWAFWVLDMHGVKDVRLLNGGREKWEREARPMTRQQQEPTQGSISLQSPDLHTRARLSQVLQTLESPTSTVLIDVRSTEEYSGRLAAPRGSSESSMRAGHIPGAINLPWSEVINTDGTFRSPEQLKALYASHGIDGSRPIITYCRIGERASHTWFALTQLLGYEASNYDGSWTEYGNVVGLPIDNPSQRSQGPARSQADAVP